MRDGKRKTQLGLFGKDRWWDFEPVIGRILKSRDRAARGPEYFWQVKFNSWQQTVVKTDGWERCLHRLANKANATASDDWDRAIRECVRAHRVGDKWEMKFQNLVAKRTGAMGVKIKELRQIMETQGYKCALTGELLTPDNSALDHINPRSKGGGNGVENFQFVTKTANRTKHTMTMDELKQFCVSHLTQIGYLGAN